VLIIGIYLPVVDAQRRSRLEQPDNEEKSMSAHRGINKSLQTWFTRKRFCLVRGLAFRVGPICSRVKSIDNNMTALVMFLSLLCFSFSVFFYQPSTTIKGQTRALSKQLKRKPLMMWANLIHRSWV